ncbi:MAG: hypothetical protein LBD97_00150 [Bifidobacteriaceae bacterium]|nr:hypothetical protein [Bifidobacteriaceae bacterium]
MSEQLVAALRGAIAGLREAAELSATRLGPGPASEAWATASSLTERLDRGVGHTIAVLQGGTGSGKSSLLNAIAEMDFADISAVRPTTDRANACVWGPGADAFLEWLGIGRESWIQRDSVLEEHVADMRGLILVDLPDYDSAVDAHRVVADRLLPLADLVVWVADPQKYADPALHSRLVEAAKAHPGRHNIVVLNQIDTVGAADAGAITQSLTQLLVEQGMTDPVVAAVSAKTGAGVKALREELAAHTARRTTALRRLAADTAAAAQRLANTASASTPTDRSWLGEAAAAAVRSLAAASAPGGEVRPASPPGAAEARTVTVAWAAEATRRLPEPWGLALDYAIGSPANIATRLQAALAPLELPPPVGGLRRLFGRAKAAARRRAEWTARVQAAIAPVVDRTMVKPTAALLADRERIRELTGAVVAAVAVVQAPGPGDGADATASAADAGR